MIQPVSGLFECFRVTLPLQKCQLPQGLFSALPVPSWLHQASLTSVRNARPECRSFSPCACSSYPIMLSKKSSSVCRWYATRLPIRTSAPQSSATFRMEEAPRLYRVTACILLNRVIPFNVILLSCGSLVSSSGEMSKSVFDFVHIVLSPFVL